jgi:ribosomal protein L32
LVHPDQNTFPIATMAIFKIPQQARETSHKNLETSRQFTAFTLLAKTISSDGTSAAPFRGERTISHHVCLRTGTASHNNRLAHSPSDKCLRSTDAVAGKVAPVSQIPGLVALRHTLLGSYENHPHPEIARANTVGLRKRLDFKRLPHHAWQAEVAPEMVCAQAAPHD